MYIDVCTCVWLTLVLQNEMESVHFSSTLWKLGRIDVILFINVGRIHQWNILHTYSRQEVEGRTKNASQVSVWILRGILRNPTQQIQSIFHWGNVSLIIMCNCNGV